METEETYKLPSYYKYLPFDVAVFIHIARNRGVVHAVKSVLSMKLIGVVRWLANHNKRFRSYLISKVKSPADLLLLKLFLANTYNEETINDMLREAENLGTKVK